MKIRFLADADLKFQIVVAVRHGERTVDFQSANEAGLKPLKDPQVLSYAAREGRILVTHDRGTMPNHFFSFIKTRQSPRLIVISQQLAISTVANDLILMWAASEPQEWVNQTFWPWQEPERGAASPMVSLVLLTFRHHLPMLCGSEHRR